MHMLNVEMVSYAWYEFACGRESSAGGSVPLLLQHARSASITCVDS